MNNKTESYHTALWVNFFTAAGIPSDVSATYALTFTENRIQNDMLLDLNKEYLRDMGITRMGDVIAILRHAKQVHENTARDKVLSTTAVAANVKVPVAAITGRSTAGASQPSSPASRILEHYTRNPQEAPPALAVKRKSLEPGYGTDVGNKKARLIRFCSPPKPTVKEAGVSNMTVFSRLGHNEPAKVVSTKPVAVKPAAKPIYSRLGNKAHLKPEPEPVDKNALKYEGILKSPPISKKTVTITTTKNVRKISCTMRADEAPLSVKDKLNLPKSKSVKFSNHVQYKEIEAIKKPQVSVTQVNKVTSFFNKPERKLSIPESNNGVKARLGTKSVNNLTITSTVFKRLGV